MKPLLVFLSTLAFAAVLLLADWDTLGHLSFAELLNSPSFLTSVFILLLGTYAFFSGTGRDSAKISRVEDSAVAEQAVLRFLSLLQGRGRLLDFVMDDVSPYSDEQVGRVARVVHQGLRDVFKETIDIEPVHQGVEGEVISIGTDFDLRCLRVVGRHSHTPPFSGKVLHRGWRAKALSLPTAVGGADVSDVIVQPLEVEVNG